MDEATRALAERREHVFGAGAKLFYDEPLHLVRGEGVHVFDADGRRYLDLYNNVPCVGHAHPHVVESIHRQVELLNVHSRYLHEGVVHYAERLVARHHDSLDRIVFTCTGSEANEVAIAMARAATGKRGIVCSDRAYHGNTELVHKLTWAGSREDPEVRAARFPDAYRPIEPGLSQEDLCERYLDDIRAAIESLESSGVGVACFVVCPLFANEGLPDVPKGYWDRATKLVREAGGLVIADEVQAGFGRSGQWWGYEAAGFVPDIATMGKPMGAGVPLGGVVAGAELVERFRKQTGYFNTFAASPLQAAAGAAVLDVIDDENLVRQAAEVGAYLKNALSRIDGEGIGDVRGQGLFLGIDWVGDQEARTPDPKGARRIVNRLRERGFLLESAGAHFNVLKIRPPLVFGRDHADSFLDAFEQTVRETDRS